MSASVFLRSVIELRFNVLRQSSNSSKLAFKGSSIKFAPNRQFLATASTKVKFLRNGVEGKYSGDLNSEHSNKGDI